MEQSKLLKKVVKRIGIGIGVGCTLIFLTSAPQMNPTLKKINSGASTNYIQTKHHDIYSYKPWKEFRYVSFIEGFKKRIHTSFGKEKIFVKKKGELEIGDTLKIYSPFEGVKYKIIKNSLELISEREFEEIVKKEENPKKLFKEKNNGINPILTHKFPKDDWPYEKLFRDKEYVNFTNYQDFLSDAKLKQNKERYEKFKKNYNLNSKKK